MDLPIIQIRTFSEIEAQGVNLIASDLEVIDAHVSEKRKRELRAWRTLLRSMLAQEGMNACAQIKYSSIGAPYIEGEEQYFSVSHCADYVALILSDRPCAVDIELKARDFSRAASRFCSAKEAEIFSDRLDILWCAKETLYKISGRTELDFLRDLEVLSYDAQSQTLVGCYLGSAQIEMKIIENEEYICVFCQI